MEIENRNDKMLRKSFMWMFLGLLVTGITSIYILNDYNLLVSLTNIYFPLLIIELIVVVVLCGRINKFSPGTAKCVFFLYAVLNALTLTPLFYLYEINSLITTFLGSSLLFLILSFVGVNTSKELSSLGPVFSVGLIVGIILTIINIFLQNTMFDLMLTWGILILFCGMTVYDINKISKYNVTTNNEDNLAIMFALELYLDFINIFIRLLSLFGDRK